MPEADTAIRRTAECWSAPDGRRKLQLALATIWLLDGVLQLQPFMFSAGPSGFGAMLGKTAAGNPRAVAKTITWNASFVDHHAVASDSIFALVQILIGLGIACRSTVRLALASSVVWSLAVWWFGEGLGGVLHGTGTPVGGGPGAVLFYALLALLLWPSDRERGRDASDPPFVAARAIGTQSATAIWSAVWGIMALLALLGTGRSPQGVHDVIQSLDVGEPGWLATIDRHAASVVSNGGMAVSVAFAIACVVIAVGVCLPPAFARSTLVLALVVAIVVWVIGENFGTILAGGATDPNSGPLIVLLALCYWPRARRPAEARIDQRPAELAALGAEGA